MNALPVVEPFSYIGISRGLFSREFELVLYVVACFLDEEQPSGEEVRFDRLDFHR